MFYIRPNIFSHKYFPNEFQNGYLLTALKLIWYNIIVMYNIMENYKILSEYKNKLINALDFKEAKLLLDVALSLTINNMEKLLLNSLVTSNRYNTKMDLDKFIVYSNVLELVYYYDDAEKIIHDIEININDIAQINTLKKIIKTKPHKQLIGKDNIIITKNCPHCNKKNFGFLNTPYIICGYNTKGYDWKGCGRDWCLKCGKKLCKSWNIDFLFNKLNRYHDSRCCKSFASKLEYEYPADFCDCNNEFVNRNR